jgi:hypothetical protein
VVGFFDEEDDLGAEGQFTHFQDVPATSQPYFATRSMMTLAMLRSFM